MNMNLSLAPIKKTIFTFFRRFHVMIFVLVVLGGASVVVFLLNGIIVRSGDTSGYTSAVNDTSFDQATIKRIEELKTRGQNNGDLNLSDGRTNPFVE